MLFQVSRYSFGLVLAAIGFDAVRPEHRVRTFALVDVASSAAMHLSLAAGGVLVAASSTFAFLDTPSIRLDCVKIITAISALIVVYLAFQFRTMATGLDTSSAHIG